MHGEVTDGGSVGWPAHRLLVGVEVCQVGIRA